MLAPAMVKFQDSLSCCTYNGAQHSHILVEENDAAAKLCNVRILAPNGDWISFNPDEGRKCKRIQKKSAVVVMSPLLAIDGHSHHCACDCVVVVNRGGQLTVVYIDLKSSNPTGYENQFKSTRQFVRYAISLLEEFHQERLVIAEERYVILYCRGRQLLNKTTTVPKSGKIGRSRPNAAYKRELNNPGRLFLKELLS